MYQYQYGSNRRAPRKRMSDYFLPFMIIALMAGILWSGWALVNRFWIQDGQSVSQEKAELIIESGSAKAMSQKKEWESVPSGLGIYAGEKVRTGPDGKATLVFPDGLMVRLSRSTEISLDKIEKKQSRYEIALALASGEAWISSEGFSDPDSSVTVFTDLLALRLRSGQMALSAPGTVYGVRGESLVDILDGRKALKTLNLGVGQQAVVDSKALEDLKLGLGPDLLFALDEAFEASDWYQWNAGEEGWQVSSAEPESDAGEGAAPAQSEASSGSRPSEAPQPSMEPSDSSQPEKEEADDSKAPSAPVVTSPKIEKNVSFELDQAEQVVQGTVEADVQKVIVNGYALSKYVPGSKAFTYYAKLSIGNLKAGDNEFTIYAEDKAGNRSEATKIILALPQSVLDEAQKAAGQEQPVPAGAVKITAPNGGSDHETDKTAFAVEGTVPSGTAKVMVNDYQLQAFKEGDTTFSYKANVSYGNILVGQANLYTAKAYDAAGKPLGSASITVTVSAPSSTPVPAPTPPSEASAQPSTSPLPESSAIDTAAPAITIPVASSQYSTNLSELVIGGTVGKDIQMVYLNDDPVPSYSLGSGKWSKTVVLQAGENLFTVYGDRNGERTAKASIAITYQP